MSFKNIIKLATERQNEIISKATPTGFPTKLAAPKKETKIKGLQSRHVQDVLEKLQKKKLERNLKLQAGRKIDSGNECLSDDSFSNKIKSDILSPNKSTLDSLNNELNLDMFTKYERRVARIDSESVPNMLELLNKREQQRKQKQLEDMQQRDEMERKRREERLALNQSSQFLDTSSNSNPITIKNSAKIKDPDLLIKENQERILKEKKLNRQKAEQEAALRLKLASSARDEMLRIKLVDTKYKKKHSKEYKKNLVKPPSFIEDNINDFKIPKKTTQHEINDTKQISISTKPDTNNILDRPLTQEEKEQLARKLANKLKQINNKIDKPTESNGHQLLKNIKKQGNIKTPIESAQFTKENDNKKEIFKNEKLLTNNYKTAKDINTQNISKHNNLLANIDSNLNKTSKMTNLKSKNLEMKNMNAKSDYYKINSSGNSDTKAELDIKKNKTNIEFKSNAVSQDLQLDKRKTPSNVNKFKINESKNYENINNELLNENEAKLHGQKHQNNSIKIKHKFISNEDKFRQSVNIKNDPDIVKDLKNKNNQISNIQNNNPNYKSSQESVTKKEDPLPETQKKNVKQNPYRPIQGQVSAWDRITKNNLKQNCIQQKQQLLNNNIKYKSIDQVYNNQKEKISKDGMAPQCRQSSDTPLEDDYEDEDGDYDEDDLSDLIDDDPVEEYDGFNYSQQIKDIFKYDKKRYLDDDDEDDLRSMESSYKQVQKEEIISKRIGRAEDLEDIRQEQLELQRRLQKKHKSK